MLNAGKAFVQLLDRVQVSRLYGLLLVYIFDLIHAGIHFMLEAVVASLLLQV